MPYWKVVVMRNWLSKADHRKWLYQIAMAGVPLLVVALLGRPMAAGLTVRLDSFMVPVVEAQQILALKVPVQVVSLLFGMK